MFKMVIIDDEEPVRYLLKNIIDLEKMDIKVVGEADDGFVGVETCRKLKPDIILTDIRMPGMDGLVLLEQVSGIIPYAKVILISGYNEFSYAQRALKAGAFDYILKPVGEEDFISSLEKAKIEILKIKTEKEENNRLKLEVKKLQTEITENSNAPAMVGSMSNNAIVNKALNYIHDNYNCDLTLEIISDRVFMNAAYFSKLFKQETGKGFNEYVSEYRLEKSKALLTLPELKINEIAGMTGFSDTSYYISVFKKLTGMTPMEYRQQTKKFI